MPVSRAETVGDQIPRGEITKGDESLNADMHRDEIWQRKATSRVQAGVSELHGAIIQSEV